MAAKYSALKPSHFDLDICVYNIRVSRVGSEAAVALPVSAEGAAEAEGRADSIHQRTDSRPGEEIRGSEVSLPPGKEETR